MWSTMFCVTIAAHCAAYLTQLYRYIPRTCAERHFWISLRRICCAARTVLEQPMRCALDVYGYKARRQHSVYVTSSAQIDVTLVPLSPHTIRTVMQRQQRPGFGICVRNGGLEWTVGRKLSPWRLLAVLTRGHM